MLIRLNRTLTRLLLFMLMIVSAASAQTEVRCDDADDVDKDRPKAEHPVDKTVKEQGKFLAVNTSLFKTARFDTDFERRSFSKPRDLTAEPSASRETDTQQQAAADDAQELAKKLANPVASLISVPFQSNFDFGMGPNEDGFRYTLNFQPVIPIKLNKDWNLISRTITPIIGQDNVVGTSAQFGLGDVLQSFFFSPNKTEPFIWGLGPQILIPTATSEYLGTQKLGLGLAGLILKQKGGWTVGTLINHTWSVAGKESRADVSLTYFQPFVSYTTKKAWTFNVNTETTYDWNAKVSNVPIHFTVSKLVKFGKRPVSVGGSLRCWAHSAPGGPQWCGFRMIITPLFPS